MSCAGGFCGGASKNLCCDPRTQICIEYNFKGGEFCAKDWSLALGSDGELIKDAEGIKIASLPFKGTSTTPSLGVFDQFKYTAYYKEPLYTQRGKELIMQSVVAAKQIFDPKKPIPQDFSKRIRNIYADPRLAHGQTSLIDPDNGIVAGWLLTDHAIFAMYGRLPLSESSHWCSWVSSGQNDCVTCKPDCEKFYNCSNFWEDCHYINFKQNTTFQDYIRFVRFVKWNEYAEGVGIDIYNKNVYLDWIPSGGACCAEECNWIEWKSFNDWREYCLFVKWSSWDYQERTWGKCKSETCGTCVTGGCGSNDCGSCKRKLPVKCCPVAECCESLPVARKFKELYPYQFGVVRCCNDYCPAYFINLVELARREACDPLCDFSKLGVGINACKYTINWYMNNQLVYTFVGIGHRMPEQFRVRENGGYAENVHVARVLVSFGTGTLLDASLPNNYNRARAKDDYIDMTALVPLMERGNTDGVPSSYYQIYHNKLGGLMPATNDNFAVLCNDVAYRLFGQGAILRVKSIAVVQKRAVNGYNVPHIICDKSCGTCDDRPGWCGPEAWDSDNDGIEACYDPCAINDPRDLSIEFVPGLTPPTGTSGSYYLPINPLLDPLGNALNPGPFGSPGSRDVFGAYNQGATSNYIITQRPIGKRFFEPKPCSSNISTGVDPYAQLS
jgi:hypothetical protein